MPNRLKDAQSPYLQQHALNPVDWWPWCDEAFEEAKRRDVPVMLSVGYAACHWCHVMAHESFEDTATAALVNEHFVAVKVDREERPDVDAVYMAATQALTGHGGWPMTVFLTHDGRPFYAGTYFPPVPRPGLASFTQVLGAVAGTWRDQRPEVEGAGERIAAALARREVAGGSEPVTAATLTAAVGRLEAEEDREHGGFGAAPKFPPSMDLEFLLRYAGLARVRRDPDQERRAAALAGRTLRAMAHSGMYDQVGGGFARYAVDRAWVVPHFEKMLYDNALLARVYLHWWRLTGDPTGARIALATCDWMLADLATAQGGLASSLDADTPVRGLDGSVHGVEGYTYVWTPAQLADVLGEVDGAWVADLARVSPAGTFEHGTSTLQLGRDVWADPQQAARWSRAGDLLAAARARRPQPGRDDKVVAAWNGLAIAALAETGALLERPDLVQAAERIADLLIGVHLVAGPGAGTGPVRARLRRVSRDGRAGGPAGVLEDYADVAEGLLSLHCVTGEALWLEVSAGLLDTVLEQFPDGSGGFFDTPADGTDAALAAVGRPRDPTDTACPGGWSAAAGALLSYASLTGSARHRQAATAALSVVARIGAQAPRAVGWGLATAAAALDGPREVAVSGRDGDPARAALHRVALGGAAPGLVVSAGEPDAAGVPLLAGRPLVGGRPAAYVCREFVCAAPVSEPGDLAAALGALFPAGSVPGISPGAEKPDPTGL